MAIQTYKLYHYQYSICSIMVRYCIAIRGKPKDETLAIEFSEHEMDITSKLEQLSEEYLCYVNPKGQVPALTSPSLPEPIYDSVKITHYLARLFPSLMPPSQADIISSLLERLHSINFFTLTFTGRSGVANIIEEKILRLIGSDVSPQYQKALQYKLEIQRKEKINCVGLDDLEEMTKRTISVLEMCSEHLMEGKKWLFGLETPTALDAHLVTFIARLKDINKGDLVPQSLLTYAAAAQNMAEWKNVVQGGTNPEIGK
ncbi:hypothetical protein V8C43DRAFT_295523 [Trichoderma afarasin]